MREPLLAACGAASARFCWISRNRVTEMGEGGRGVWGEGNWGGWFPLPGVCVRTAQCNPFGVPWWRRGGAGQNAWPAGQQGAWRR